MGTRINVPGADYSGLGVGWFGQPIPPTNLVAAYFPGSQYPNPPDWDYSLNDEELTGVATINPGYMVGGSASYFQAPFTGAVLGEAASLFAVIKRSSTTSPTIWGGDIGNGSGSDQSGIGLGAEVTSGSSSAYAAFSNPNNSTSNQAQLATDSYTGTGFELLVGTMSATSVNLHRRAPSISQMATPLSVTAVAMGVNPFTVGKSGAYGATDEIAAFGVYASVLASTDVDTLYAALKTFLASQANPIAI